MVKSKLISEEDIQHLNDETDETLKDLPEDVDATQDEVIVKINSILKGSKKKSKLNKKATESDHGRNFSEVETKVPTTK